MDGSPDEWMGRLRYMHEIIKQSKTRLDLSLAGKSLQEPCRKYFTFHIAMKLHPHHTDTPPGMAVCCISAKEFSFFFFSFLDIIADIHVRPRLTGAPSGGQTCVLLYWMELVFTAATLQERVITQFSTGWKHFLPFFQWISAHSVSLIGPPCQHAKATRALVHLLHLRALEPLLRQLFLAERTTHWESTQTG